MDYKRYTAGLGQKAEQLPPSWKCYTEAEVETIVQRVLNDRLIDTNKKSPPGRYEA